VSVVANTHLASLIHITLIPARASLDQRGMRWPEKANFLESDG